MGSMRDTISSVKREMRAQRGVRYRDPPGQSKAFLRSNRIYRLMRLVALTLRLAGSFSSAASPSLPDSRRILPDVGRHVLIGNFVAGFPVAAPG